ncbi:TMV resistance protein N [Morella rubra]|uniref:TMV resistance protein N n=1 Tax=Morella rubra TaxID=262757 RepID=A0A6A1UJL9_9ROSI|nr:TMV resistance protein N [Morella rubra]
MKKLRLFISHGARFRGKPLKYLPNELRVLVWDNYPSQVLPPKFVRNQLRVFRMHNSFIQKLGGGEFKKLTRMELTGCNELREISDLSSSSNLKELDILDCPKLVKVHKSVGSLGNLVSLMFWRCCELRSFPKSLKLRSLKQLFISNCKRLKDFPEIECEMENVTTLSLHSTGINKLPSSIANLSRLKHFYLKECKPSALSLPRSIFQIKALEIFYLNDCPKAVLFGKNVGHNGQNTAPIMFSDFARNVLEDLNLNGSGLSQPDLFSILFDCSDHGLKKLYLRGMNIDMLPSDMARFVRLTRLDLDDCKNLREIPELPQNIKEISARGCRSLERFSQLPKILWQFNESGLQDLKEVDVTGCHNLVCDVPKTSMFQGYPAGNGIAFMAAFPGSKKPDSLHPCEKNSGVFEIDIDALRNLDKNIRGIALYVVFGTTYGKDVIVVEYGRKPLWSHGTRLCYDSRDSMTSNHVLLLYISAIDIEGIQTILLYDSDLRVIEYCGFCPVYENDEEEAAKDKSKMLYEGVDSNLESRWERKRKNS